MRGAQGITVNSLVSALRHLAFHDFFLACPIGMYAWVDK